MSSPSPALTEERLTPSQRLQELPLFAVLELAQALLDKELCSTEAMKTCGELPFAHVSKVGVRVNSSKGKRRETRCEGSRSSAEVSLGQREGGGMSRGVGRVEQFENGFAVFARTLDFKLLKIRMIQLPNFALQTPQTS